MKTIAILFAAIGVLADAYETHLCLQDGRREANPILRRVLGAQPPLWAAIAWRAVVFIPLALWVPMPVWAWFVFGGLFWAVAIRNAGFVDRSY